MSFESTTHVFVFHTPNPPKILKCESWISENLLKNGSILRQQSLNISEKSVKIKLPECQKKHLFFHQIFRHYLRYVSCLWGEKCNLEVQTYRHYLRYVSVLNAISADTHKVCRISPLSPICLLKNVERHCGVKRLELHHLLWYIRKESIITACTHGWDMKCRLIGLHTGGCIYISHFSKGLTFINSNEKEKKHVLKLIDWGSYACTHIIKKFMKKKKKMSTLRGIIHFTVLCTQSCLMWFFHDVLLFVPFNWVRIAELYFVISTEPNCIVSACWIIFAEVGEICRSWRCFFGRTAVFWNTRRKNGFCRMFN